MKRVFTISIDPELFDMLEALSKQTRVSRSRIVSDILRGYLELASQEINKGVDDAESEALQ